MKIKNDFSWRVWLTVLALHALAFVGLDAALTLTRLEASPNSGVQAFIVQPEAPVPAPMPTPKAVPAIATALVKPIAQAVAVPFASSLPVPEDAAQTPPVVTALVSKAAQERYAPPDSIRLLYTVTKGNDSAKASLSWRMQSHADGQASYELTYEAMYFGVSVVKQTSVGWMGDGGLVPVRFGDKRRGKSEQATHFDASKQRITFSNNRPQIALAIGSQDRSSVLIQLASLFAADSTKWRTGQVIEIPVASTDELETWRFEVQGETLLALPAGERSAIHLIRRARKAFDQTIELWLAPSLSYLPARMRHIDSSGVTDVQLLGSEKL